MGVASSTSRFEEEEEDKALQLCRDRKKFIKQALDRRCSLAAAHIVYTGELRIIGAALTTFIVPVELQPRPLTHFHLNAMEEKPASPVMVSTEAPWDYFGLFHPTDQIEYGTGDEQMPELEDAEGSEDEFDEEPSSASLVRSFTNVNAKEEENVGSDISETKSVEGKNIAEVLPKDFFSSISDIEHLFVQASESGREVPRMLEAATFRYNPTDERSLLKSCLSCGKDPGCQDSVTYQTRSSSSSQNPLLTTSTDLFCMVSGSHAPTLDRIYAWEKKLYTEVKAAQVLKADFDHKCNLLRRKESRGENAETKRASVKDLHSRIQVAIHRITSISKKIEEIRDMELQPQLEELIQGLRKMWETMAWCHRLQLHIISVSSIPKNVQIKLHLQATDLHLGNELNSLPSTFTKWIATQKAYVESLDKWLFKCVALPQNPIRRNRRMKPLPLRNWGPPIYMICGAWMEMIDGLPVEAITSSVRALATEVAQFMPHHKGKDRSDHNINKPDDHQTPPVEQFQATLASFMQELMGFAECSVKMYGELQNVIEGAKSNYEQFKLQQRQARDSEGHVI